MTTEVVHSLVAECAESALTPTSPGSAVWEPQEHEYVLPHVGQPHSAFRETEGERRSRLSAQRIAQSSARLLPNEVVRLMHQDDKDPIVPFLDAKLSKQGCVDVCRGKIGSGLISLFMEDPMTSNEQKVLAYLVSEVSSGSEVHVPNSLISKNTSLDKSTICRVLQSLGQKGVVVQRESKQDRWAPVLVINPSIFYVGTDEGLEDAISDFDLLRLTVVK